MSASREKKSRQSDPTQGLTQKQRKELQEQQAAKRKTVLYTVIGVIIAALVVVLLVWHSGVFQRGKTALTVGDMDYSVTDVSYYFSSAMNQLYQNTYGAFDPGEDLRTQYVDEEQTQSYFDLILKTATENLTSVAAVEKAAQEAGYTMTDADKASVEQTITSMKQTAESYGYNYDGYLKAVYGKYMTPSAFQSCVEREVMVVSYRDAYADTLDITDGDIQTYYEEHAADLDSYNYRYIYIDGQAASTTDDEGNTVEPTEEESAAAMEAARDKADAFLAAVEAADDQEDAFAQLAPDYVAESSRERYEADPDASLNTGVLGSSSTLSSGALGTWLKDDSRTPGELGVVESSSGCYVALFLNRYRDEDATADIRHILIMAELTQEDDPATEDVDESKAPTQEALDAAKAEAEELLAQWEAGDKTAESFGALANEYSDDPGSNTTGGLYEQVYKGLMFEGFNDWIFADGRQVGDTGLVENPQSGQQGWHIIYLQDWDEPLWKLTSKNALTNEQLTTWLDGLTEGLEATQGEGMQYVGK